MPRFSTESIRNLCFVGNAGVGKTTLIEALLKTSGAITNAGSVEKGNTVSDFDPQEKMRLHSLNSSVMSVDLVHGGVPLHFNLLDTPGLSDFRGPALAAMAAVETVACVISAQSGLDGAALQLLERAKARGNERLLLVNKIDADGVNIEALMGKLREQLGSECLPLNLPSADCTRVLDCLSASGGSDPLAYSTRAAAHQQIIDQIVEINPAVMEHYLDEGEAKLSFTELHDAFEQCLRESHLLPVVFVSARSGAGLTEFLDILMRWLPNPAEGNPPPFLKGEGDKAIAVHAKADANAHVIAHVFKVVNDPFIGKLSVFRIYQGTVKKDTQLFIGDGRKPIKVNHLYKLFGREHTEIESGIAGDICAVAKIDDLGYDSLMHDSHDEDHWHLLPLAMPRAMFGLSVQPASRGHEQKLSSGLSKLAEEDPSLRIEHHADLNETVLLGLGDLQLRVTLERLKERYQVEVKTAPPRIAYRETITINAEGHHRHKKQTGGAGQFGEVFLRIKPLARGEGFRFVDETHGGSIPYNFLPAVEKGVRTVLEKGAIAGFPLQDMEVAAFDGKHHPVDSKEVAFVTAGKRALLDAISKAKAVVLEPLVTLSVTLPEAAMGDVTAGLANKRARIQGTDSLHAGELSLNALVPLSELKDYQNELKSQTGGLGSYSIDFSHYEAVPAQVQKQLVDAYRPQQEED